MIESLFGFRLKADAGIEEGILEKCSYRRGFFFMQVEENTGDLKIRATLPVANLAEKDENVALRALLFLDSRHGTKFLSVPEGDDEMDVVLGYTEDKVLYLEHELEEGKEEYHLHLRPMNPAWKRRIWVLVLKETRYLV